MSPISNMNLIIEKSMRKITVKSLTPSKNQRLSKKFGEPGREVAGRIVADMTFLKDQGHIHPVNPEPGLKSGSRHYRVDFDLVMKIEGRNIRFEARYPSGPEGQIQASGRFSIAAAFVPGTA